MILNLIKIIFTITTFYIPDKNILIKNNMNNNLYYFDNTKINNNIVFLQENKDNKKINNIIFLQENKDNDIDNYLKYKLIEKLPDNFNILYESKCNEKDKMDINKFNKKILLPYDFLYSKSNIFNLKTLNLIYNKNIKLQSIGLSYSLLNYLVNSNDQIIQNYCITHNIKYTKNNIHENIKYIMQNEIVKDINNNKKNSIIILDNKFDNNIKLLDIITISRFDFTDFKLYLFSNNDIGNI
jgi:hypothetical protein